MNSMARRMFELIEPIGLRPGPDGYPVGNQA